MQLSKTLLFQMGSLRMTVLVSYNFQNDELGRRWTHSVDPRPGVPGWESGNTHRCLRVNCCLKSPVTNLDSKYSKSLTKHKKKSHSQKYHEQSIGGATEGGSKAQPWLDVTNRSNHRQQAAGNTAKHRGASRTILVRLSSRNVWEGCWPNTRHFGVIVVHISSDHFDEHWNMSLYAV